MIDLFEWILSSSALVLAVVLLRYAFKGRMGLRLQYALWLPVLLRLLLPFSFGETAMSLGNLLPEEPGATTVVGVTVLETAREKTLILPDATDGGTPLPPPDTTPQDPAPRPPQTSLSLAEAAVTVWAAGSWLFLLALVAANARFAARLQRSRQPLEADSPLPVYLTEAVDSPCLFGLPTPSIYVTAEAAADAAALTHVLRHEQTHARHLDHIWAALRALALVLHWYNPLVWLAASLSRRDAELACDEATVAALGEEARSDYGRTLIALSCAKGGAGSLLTAATTMTGGRRTIRERITLLAKNPKTALGTFLLVTALAAVAVGCTFTGAEEGHDFSEWTATLTAEEIQWAELSRGYGVDVLSYTVPEAEYEALCTLLGGITDDQCHRRNPAGDDID